MGGPAVPLPDDDTPAETAPADDAQAPIDLVSLAGKQQVGSAGMDAFFFGPGPWPGGVSGLAPSSMPWGPKLWEASEQAGKRHAGKQETPQLWPARCLHKSTTPLPVCLASGPEIHNDRPPAPHGLHVPAAASCVLLAQPA